SSSRSERRTGSAGLRLVLLTVDLLALLLGEPAPHPVGLAHRQRVGPALLQDGAARAQRLGPLVPGDARGSALPLGVEEHVRARLAAQRLRLPLLELDDWLQTRDRIRHGPTSFIFVSANTAPEPNLPGPRLFHPWG